MYLFPYNGKNLIKYDKTDSITNDLNDWESGATWKKPRRSAIGNSEEKLDKINLKNEGDREI